MQARINLIGELCGCAALGIATHLLKQPKAVILHGMKANNGKSQLLSIIKGLLPSGAITAIAPQRFEDDNQIARLAGVHLNAASELGNSTAIVADRFKAIVTGDPVDVRPVYRDPITVQPTALHVYATNVLPPFTGGFDRGVRRRLLVLEFDRTIPEEEMMPDLGARIVDEEAEALIAFAVRGASRVIRNGALTEPASSAESLRQWITGTDPVLGWLDECAEFEEGAVVSQRTARENCLAWAVKEGFDRGRFPGARTFAQRVLAADGRIKRGRTRAEGRVFYGLKITQYDDPVHEVAAAMEPGG